MAGIRSLCETIHLLLLNHRSLTDHIYGSSIQGTVLLNANVAFLDIGYVGDSAKAGIAQFLSYVSIVASAGSIVLGLRMCFSLRLLQISS